MATKKVEDNFCLYKGWYESLELFEDEQEAAHYLYSLAKYHFTGEEPTIKKELLMFKQIKFSIDKRKAKSNAGRAARTKPEQTPEQNPKNINDNINDKDKVKDNTSGCAGAEATPPEGENYLPPSSLPKKPKKPPLREREPQNNMEKVEKAYLKNWDTLYTEKRVKTPDPVVNWNQTRNLIKKHFEQLSPEQIIQALNVGMADNFIMSGGYSLGIMLSASVLNRLINSGQSGGPAPPPSLKDKKSLKGLDSWNGPPSDRKSIGHLCDI
ncbi:hypothetical protein FACS189485_18110 [Spirochaetia bacterium]|nr:hypothetical protein FACS189485_18110 [Spirochaetia bacterium]